MYIKHDTPVDIACSGKTITRNKNIKRRSETSFYFNYNNTKKIVSYTPPFISTCRDNN